MTDKKLIRALVINLELRMKPWKLSYRDQGARATSLS
jgi:hypothetical protein